MIKSKDFESALSELETVVTTLDGELQLEKALQLFERGMQLSRQCETFLNGAKQKVEVLKRSSEGVITIEPFENDESQTDNPAASVSEEEKVTRASDADGGRTVPVVNSRVASDTQLNLNLKGRAEF